MLDTLKANSLRHLVVDKLKTMGYHSSVARAYWKGVEDTLYVCLALNRPDDKTTAEELFRRFESECPRG